MHYLQHHCLLNFGFHIYRSTYTQLSLHVLMVNAVRRRYWRFEDLAAVTLNIPVFCDVTLCRHVRRPSSRKPQNSAATYITKQGNNP